MTSGTAENLKNDAESTLQENLPGVLAFSHLLHQHPELGFGEHQAVRWLAEELTKVPGTRVEVGLGQLPTALKAEVGTGDLVLTICAEYDALPGIGHACGHNIIAAAALGAFTALAPMADRLDVTLRLLGTPAEETGGGKVLMLEQGDFDGTHAAMMVHPGDVDEVEMLPYACAGYRVTFHGRSAHASAHPWDGINALDAITVALTAIGLARQQLEPGQQIHGFVDSAGTAPNVIPELATGQWMVRAHDVESLARATTVLNRCLEAGALAAGARLEVVQDGPAYAEFRTDTAIAELFGSNSAALGRHMNPASRRGGSTDMANVSHHFPTIHPMISLGDGCPPIHNQAFAEAAAAPAGDKAIRDGALAMAWTCIDLAARPESRTRLLDQAAAKS
ncbi:amidohydrolase [Paenarthrobacter sp. PH39-S1]|uniref:amidohydrolase n=1 Tax=Paenarthrobacter sp. PH39-S1 TaxID=3046204 RepID=UPI0024B9B59E|nr:amidohydrolase [Paenarthrobacter sp. PH39-S1]MDJ0357938.1 amidohydrolase [Paenarthrobacter sp. PH39-S1]